MKMTSDMVKKKNEIVASAMWKAWRNRGNENQVVGDEKAKKKACCALLRGRKKKKKKRA